MVTNRGQVRVEQLAAETGWSRKRLWSRFRSQIGLTPKRAAQLIRFDHAAHRLAAGHGAALVAAESGYADQSHLHRDVRAFTGATPTAIAAAPWLAVDPIAWATPQHPPSTQPTPPPPAPPPPAPTPAAHPPPPAPPAANPPGEPSPKAPRRSRRLTSCACPRVPQLASSPAPPAPPETGARS